MIRNDQVIQSKIEFGITKKQSLITCKSCGQSAIIYTIMLPENKWDTPTSLEQGTWSYCPFCGIKNNNPIG